MLKISNIFLQQIKKILGDDFDSFVAALHKEPVVSLRKNSCKFSAFECESKVAWCDTGIYLPERITFTLDPDFHAGAYYVQEASSMFLEQIIKQYFYGKSNVIALDMCAAPGGKSTHLLSLLPENSLLVANETIRSRAKILYENIVKWGNHNIVITNNDPKDFSSLANFFDLILIDAPCSGEGMFRKDRDTAGKWSEGNVKLCAERQRRILADAWTALKPEGLLVYCTCTYNIEENEANVKWFTDNFPATCLPLKTQPAWGISENLISNIFSYRFYPYKTHGEGFCISVLQKEGKIHACKKNESRNQKNISKNMHYVKNYLQNHEKYNFLHTDNEIKAMHSELVNETNIVLNHLRCLYSGVLLGTVKGNDFVPAHALALSTALNRHMFQQVNLDAKSALHFLHRDSICYPKAYLGYNLVCCNNNALGWIKNIGSRVNNLYPQDWRILMDLQ